jgi:hypothetical protein
VLTLKNGVIIEPDRGPAEDFTNWSLEGAISYDAVPDPANALSTEQRAFVRGLAGACAAIEPEQWKGAAIHQRFHRLQQDRGLPLRDAVLATLDSFLTNRFYPPVGFFLASLDRDLVLERLNAVGADRAISVPV